MVYKFKPGYSAGVPAQVAGEELDRIRRENGDTLTPGLVVDESRPEDAALHPAFEWDDPTAAEKYREDQARRIIRNVYPIHVDERTGESRPVLGYVSVDLPDAGRRYITTARAMSDDELREQVLEDAVKAFEALRTRYQHIRDLAPIFQAIDRVKVRRRARRPQVAETAR